MTHSTQWTKALAEHRTAIADFAEFVRGIPADRWRRESADGKWSPAEEALHIRQVYEVTLATLAGGPGLRSRVPEWQATLLRYTFLPLCLALGRLPRGIRAPREVKPDLAVVPGATPASIAADVVERATRFERIVDAAAGRGEWPAMRHPYFGMIGGTHAVRFLSVHTRHHLRHLMSTT